MEEKLSNKGGKRLGAGRKPILDKKKQVNLYFVNRDIIKFGNEQKMKDSIYRFVSEFGLSVQDLTQPTHQIKPIEAIKPEINAVVSVQPRPLISPYNRFREELAAATTVKEIERIMANVRAEPMMPREKMLLDSYAKELSKDMFTD